ncbi:MAG TPA: hypothetical protein VFC78_22200 [Tepidisphaeraceae bacterium]|nr:hypothetical protein [Tepidisphaeraceae bacterium]
MPATPPPGRRAQPHLLRWVLVGMLGFFFTIAIGVTYGILHKRSIERKCDLLATWVKTTHPAGAYPSIALPAGFADMSEDHTVNAVVLPDGRVVLLLRTSLGWHHNWSGTVYCTTPLQSADFGQDANGRPTINIKGLDDHYITEKASNHLYHVAFDLG